MAIFSFTSLFNFTFTKKTDPLRQIVPALTVLKRKAITPAFSRNTHSKSSTTSSGSSQAAGAAEPATEASTLGTFPRPNLYTTLQTRIGLYSAIDEKARGQQQKCSHCAGPHSTEYCPC